MTSNRSSTRASAAALAIAIVLAASGARAQNSAAIAEGLFRDGKKLLDEKRYAEACPKFEESARIDPSSGVKLALGICYEGVGKLASAWGAYLDTITLARRDGRKDREKAASERADALEPKLAHVTFEVPPDVARLSGVVLKEDGVVIGAAAWTKAPIDAGPHTLEVTAPGKRPYSASFEVKAADSTTVRVPELEDAPAPVALGEPAPVPIETTTHPLSTYGFVALGVGAASIVAGSILGGVAIADAGDVRKLCSPPTCSNAAAVAENSTAATLADWSTVTFIVGGVCLAASVVLFLVKGKRTAAAAALQPAIGPRWAGIGGAW